MTLKRDLSTLLLIVFAMRAYADGVDISLEGEIDLGISVECSIRGVLTDGLVVV